METGTIPTQTIYREFEGHGPGNSFHFSSVANSIIHSAESPNAQLLEFKNLVIKIGNDSDPENFPWQSFDSPCNTLLQGMKFGRNIVTGLDGFPIIWKSTDDPIGLILMAFHN